jgi:hypothetical protein
VEVAAGLAPPRDGFLGNGHRPSKIAQCRRGPRARAATEALRPAASNSRQKATARVKSEPGPPMTLGNAAAARVRLIVWCKACQHQVEPDPAEMAAQYGAATSVLDWRERLVCSRCGGRQADMVVSGTEKR